MRLEKRAAAAIVALACGFPVAFLLVLSLAEQWVPERVWPSGLATRRWLAVLDGEGQLAASLALSLVVSLMVAAIGTAAGFLASRAIAYSRHRNALLLLAYVPYAFSPVVLGACLLFLYLKLELAGTAAGVVLAQTTFAFGFATVFFVDFWTPEKKAFEELVYTLGGSTWAAYRRALLPLSSGMLRVAFFQTFLISWFQYGLTLLVGSGKVKTLPLEVFDYVNEADIFYAAVASCLLVLPPLVLLAVNRRLMTGVLR